MNRNADRPNQPSLAELLNLKEEDIDWIKAHEYACCSLVKVACDLWNSGVNSTTTIAKNIGNVKSTIIKYLKQGAELGWCDYNTTKAIQINNFETQKRQYKKIICLTTGELFNSLKDAGEKYNIHPSNISSCCRRKTKYAGKHPETEEKMVWNFY